MSTETLWYRTEGVRQQKNTRTHAFAHMLESRHARNIRIFVSNQKQRGRKEARKTSQRQHQRSQIIISFRVHSMSNKKKLRHRHNSKKRFGQNHQNIRNDSSNQLASTAVVVIMKIIFHIHHMVFSIWYRQFGTLLNDKFGSVRPLPCQLIAIALR